MANGALHAPCAAQALLGLLGLLHSIWSLQAPASPRAFQTFTEDRKVENNEDKQYYGRLIPCTYEEKVCLSYGTLYNPATKRCLLSLDEWCHYVPPAAREQIANGTGHLFAMCPDGCSIDSLKNTARCRNATEKPAFTCSCLSHYYINYNRSVPMPKIMGGHECQCVRDDSPMRQPHEEGLCRIPRLYIPATEGAPLGHPATHHKIKSEVALYCEAGDRSWKCFSNGTVWAGYKKCDHLLRRGPCQRNHILAIDPKSNLGDDIKIVCVPKSNNCEKGFKRMLFDNKCHSERELSLISVSPIFRTLFSLYHLSWPNYCVNQGLRIGERNGYPCSVFHEMYPANGTENGDAKCAPPFRKDSANQDNSSNHSAADARGHPSKAVGLQGYARYHANDSYIGQPLPCTFEEKFCFGYNMLYYPPTGRCQSSVNLNGHTVHVHADPDIFLRGSGHLVGAPLAYLDPCPGYRMAYDGQCYPKALARAVLCGCAAEPSPHFLGGVECRCGAAEPVRVEQPAEDGRCRIPDLRFPDAAAARAALPDYDPRVFSVRSCARRHFECFAKGKVWVEGKGGGGAQPSAGNRVGGDGVDKDAGGGGKGKGGAGSSRNDKAGDDGEDKTREGSGGKNKGEDVKDGEGSGRKDIGRGNSDVTNEDKGGSTSDGATGGCFALNERGPCAENHTVALVHNRLDVPAVCKSANGDCPANHIRMAFDAKCHAEREVRLQMPIEGQLAGRNVFGDWELATLEHGTNTYTLMTENESKLCVVRYKYYPHWGSHKRYSHIPCTDYDSELCFMHEVRSEAPSPQQEL